MKFVIAMAVLFGSLTVQAQTNGVGGAYLNDVSKKFRCHIEVSLAERIINDASNSEDSQEKAMTAANISLSHCKEAARQFSRSLSRMLELATKSCDDSANQGLSDYFRASCYNKAAELVAKITNQ